MRVWLHDVTSIDQGWTAWCLDVQGFATWAATEAEVIAKVPRKMAEHQAWLTKHDLPTVEVGSWVEIVERVSGDEVAFSQDHAPCCERDIDITLRLLAATREDLISCVESLPEKALDWDPPYSAFPEWANWRSIREVLAHVASCETHYYLRAIGHESKLPPASPSQNWKSSIGAHRDEVIDFLETLKTSTDRARVVVKGGESWSARKVLRRLVWHELLHWKSIRRIGRDFMNCQGAEIHGSEG